VGSSGRQSRGIWRICGRTVIVRERARRGAHEALPHPPPGGKPPETPAPFPSGSMFQNGGSLSRVRKPRKNGAPLTASLRSEGQTEMRERGPQASGCRDLPLVGPEEWLKTRGRRSVLDKYRPSHGSRGGTRGERHLKISRFAFSAFSSASPRLRGERNTKTLPKRKPKNAVRF
jgi:hypothetical protein